jgi:hypothetical protein
LRLLAHPQPDEPAAEDRAKCRAALSWAHTVRRKWIHAFDCLRLAEKQSRKTQKEQQKQVLREAARKQKQRRALLRKRLRGLGSTLFLVNNRFDHFEVHWRVTDSRNFGRDTRPMHKSMTIT